jgi:hypothetical protein
MTEPRRAADNCTNCGAALVGEFCQACGQKRFVESDRRIGHLLGQFVGNITDLDGRVWRTLRALLFQPGLLSREYMEGRRARWMTPASIFLAVSVIYFLAPLRGGDLTLQFNQQVSPPVRAQALGADETLSEPQQQATGQWYSRYTAPWIERRVTKRDAAVRVASKEASGYSMRDYRVAYDAKADDVSKALVILHVPFAALALMLLFRDQRRYYAEHFVVALHFLAFWMIALEVIYQVGNLVHRMPPEWQPSGTVYDWFMRILLSAYAIAALRRAYSVGWIRAVASAAVWEAAIVFVNLYVYRAVQFVVTFALT